MEPTHIEMLLAALRENGLCTIRVQGASMWPFIRSNDRITIERYSGGELAAGMVVAVLGNKQIIVHRIVRSEKSPDTEKRTKIWIAGDSSPVSEACINQHEIIGTVTSICGKKIRTAIVLGFPWRILVSAIGMLLRRYVNKRYFSPPRHQDTKGFG